jgi:isocitrate dehydrogenase
MRLIEKFKEKLLNKIKRKRQALRTTIKELRKITNDLEEQQREENKMLGIEEFNEDMHFQLDIINKTPRCCDTWEFDNE